MNLPSDVTLPELKLHLEFKDTNDPFKNSVETSKYFSDTYNYAGKSKVDIKRYIDKKIYEVKDSTFIVDVEKLFGLEPTIMCSAAKVSDPFYVEYYMQIVDRENGKYLLTPSLHYTNRFTDNLIDPPAGRDSNFFDEFMFNNQFWSNFCNVLLAPWCYGNSQSEYGPTFESINDDVDKKLYYDVNGEYFNAWTTPESYYEAAVPLYFKDPTSTIISCDYRDFFNSEKLKEYAHLKDNDDFLKIGFLKNLDSNNIIHLRYYINDILVMHLKSKQTHSPSNISDSYFKLFFGLNSGFPGDKFSWLSIIKDFKIYCHIDNDEIIIKKNIQDGIAGTNWFNCDINVVEKKNIQDGIAGSNWFNCDIKVIEDPSLKSKEAVEDEINKQLALNPYIDLDELQIFAKINDNNLYPVQFAIQDGKVHIKYTDFIAKKQLYIGSKRQFIHHQYIL